MYKDNYKSFDPERAQMMDSPFRPPIIVGDPSDYPLLKEGAEQHNLQVDLPIIAITINKVSYVLPTVHMTYAGIAQGEANGTPWVLTLCPICNGGTVFSPVVDGTTYHFAKQGLYNSMELIADQETTSYWDHINGVALHGPLAGKQMKPIASMNHSTLSRALIMYPQARLIFTDLNKESQEIADEEDVFRRDDNRTPEIAENTVGIEEDTRLPRLDMGLGVWNDDVQRYYPLLTLHRSGKAIIDSFDGRNIAVYIDDETHVPSAIYTDATSIEADGDRFVLDNGQHIQDGMLYDGDGNKLPTERPLQLFQRWFGFSFSFPQPEIYDA